MTKRQSVLAAAAQRAKAGSAAASAGEGTRAANPAAAVFSERQTLLNDIAGGRRRDVVQRLVEPEQCRMWRRHNRIYDRLDEKNCADLIGEIGEKGQKIPAIVRKLKDDPGSYEFEVICGARRHFAVSYLRDKMGRSDVLYLVEIRSLTDEEAFQLSDLENRARRDISDFERGIDYQSALTEFYNGNVSTMAERIGIARQSLSNYLYLARLPEEVVKAYSDPTGIAVRHGTVLVPLLNDPAKATGLRERAREIAGEQARAQDLGGALAYDGPVVFRMLREAGEATRKATRARVEKIVVPACGGGELFSLEKGSRSITIKIPRSRLERKKEVLDNLKKHL